MSVWTKGVALIFRNKQLWGILEGLCSPLGITLWFEKIPVANIFAAYNILVFLDVLVLILKGLRSTTIWLQIQFVKERVNVRPSRERLS